MPQFDESGWHQPTTRWALSLALGCASGTCAISCGRDWDDLERRPVQSGGGSGSAGEAGRASAGAGASGGTASSVGGSPAGGTSAAGGYTAGSDGAGGAGVESTFPATGILDDFNRSGALGSQWFHPQVENYEVNAERLECTLCSFVHPALWREPFGPNQEVYATLAAFNEGTADGKGAGTSEISLILLSQGGSCDEIQVVYSPSSNPPTVAVDICRQPNFFTLWRTERTLDVGSRLGARVLPGNQIEVWVNDERIRTVDASVWEFTSGYIGVTAHNFPAAPTTIAWDDFGGGEY